MRILLCFLNIVYLVREDCQHGRNMWPVLRRRIQFVVVEGIK